MFKKDSINDGGTQETVVAQGVKVDGEFVCQGNIIIEGEVHGTIKTEHNLRVGEQARIVANVQAENAVVSGEVQGNMKVAEQLELTPTSRVSGDIEAKVISIAPGAIFCGKCSMPGGAEVVNLNLADKKRSNRSKSVIEEEELQPIG